MTTGGKSYYYLTDAADNVLGLVDDGGKRTRICAYDPQLGRFTQPAPSGQETNPYLYAASVFINNRDPTGPLSLRIRPRGHRTQRRLS
jgi:RHS repeat-associated protein